jgi:hypothetical protein
MRQRVRHRLRRNTPDRPATGPARRPPARIVPASKDPRTRRSARPVTASLTDAHRSGVRKRRRFTQTRLGNRVVQLRASLSSFQRSAMSISSSSPPGDRVAYRCASFRQHSTDHPERDVLVTASFTDARHSGMESVQRAAPSVRRDRVIRDAHRCGMSFDPVTALSTPSERVVCRLASSFRR